MSMTPEERTLRARIAVNTSWANTHDPAKRTEPARSAFDARFLNQVDPDRVLPEDERERRAASAKKAYMASLALKSVAGRRKAAEARKKADQIEREAADAYVELALNEAAT